MALLQRGGSIAQAVVLELAQPLSFQPGSMRSAFNGNLPTSYNSLLELNQFALLRTRLYH